MKLGNTLLNILKALAIVAVLTLIGVQLLGCTPHTLEECASSATAVRAYSIIDCTRTPGCETDSTDLTFVRKVRVSHPQCFTEHFP